MTQNETLFRIEIGLIDGDVHTVDGIPAAHIEECIRSFVNREGGEQGGLKFGFPGGEVKQWMWDEIRSVGAVRMVALTEIEMLPRLIRCLHVPQAPL